MIAARTLAQLHNRPTSYEIVMVINGKQTRLGFTQRRTQQTLLKHLMRNIDTVRASADDLDLFKATRHALLIGNNVAIRYSGRTERDCAESV